MTEAEWLTSGDAQKMIRSLPRSTWGERRGRLFTVACSSQLRVLPDDSLTGVIETSERFADGQADDAELCAAIEKANAAVEWEARHDMTSPRSHAAEVIAAAAAFPAEEYTAISELLACLRAEHGSRRGIRAVLARTNQVLAGLVRDLACNPFRPVTFAPSWRASTAVALAGQMYESRDFSAMPILADALQDAGCDSADVLDHCRGAGPHVRGCWVVDLVLAKE
jgi:hypothetical protein